MKLLNLFLYLFVLWNHSAQAQLLEVSSNVQDQPTLHSFVSQGYITTSDNNYIRSNSHKGLVGFTEIGFNLTKQVSNNFRTGFQLFATNTNTVDLSEKFEANVDWFYADYHLREELSLKLGRLKIPFGLYNEIHDVDTGRTTLLLPSTVYPITNRTFLLAQSGIEIYGEFELGTSGSLGHRLYAGTIDIDNPTPALGVTYQDINVPYLYGGRLMWESPGKNLKLAYSLQALKIEYDFVIANQSNELTLPALLQLGSIEYVHNNFYSTFEFGQWDADLKSNNESLQPNLKSIQERFYLQFSYRLNEWLHPGIYYGEFYPKISKRTEREDYQKDASIFVRMDINPFWIIKASLHDMQGTANLTPLINENKPLNKLKQRWQAFILKTTFYY